MKHWGKLMKVVADTTFEIVVFTAAIVILSDKF
ncbi:hypothetical protein [Aeromonas phage yong1]|uniref:Uncharacterized protein n=1 Tax=Aeromonas phage yong1 TaxID=2924882 RepID=A0A9X9E1A4_9CAUD|nr:hypothetical protein [Aeromonas phage yong1]